MHGLVGRDGQVEDRQATVGQGTRAGPGRKRAVRVRAAMGQGGAHTVERGHLIGGATTYNASYATHGRGEVGRFMMQDTGWGTWES